MASKQLYPCFACRKAGYEIPVYLDGKDEQGHTKYLNEDGTRHIHKVQVTQAQQQAQPKSEYDKSVDNGITAFGMMSSLIGLVEQNQKVLVTLNEKMDHLGKLVYALTEEHK